MKKYRIEFESGRAFEGTPKAIVEQLRNSSFTEYDKPLRVYMFNTSRRHKMVYGKRLSCISYQAYLRSLADAKFTVKFNVLDE